MEALNTKKDDAEHVDPFFHVLKPSLSWVIKMMIDFKDAVNLSTNKDLWRNFSSISNPLSVAICCSS